MRQDISMDPELGEINTTDQLTNKTVYDFKLLDNIPGDNEQFCYGEITVPGTFDSKFSDGHEIHIDIPYTASYKELQVRFRLSNGTDHPEYLINKQNNQTWFLVGIADDTGEMERIQLSRFRQYNEANHFKLVLRNGMLILFSGNETDLVIHNAEPQNEVFLLKATAGNLYNYPVSGVGLISYLHANYQNTDLANKLKDEFEKDGMPIEDAYIDVATGELQIVLKQKL